MKRNMILVFYFNEKSPSLYLNTAKSELFNSVNHSDKYYNYSLNLRYLWAQPSIHG